MFRGVVSRGSVPLTNGFLGIKALREQYPHSHVAFDDPISNRYHIGNWGDADATHQLEVGPYLGVVRKYPIESLHERMQTLKDAGGALHTVEDRSDPYYISIYKLNRVR